MDAVKFLEESSRMCNTYNDCTGCPMEDKPFCYPSDLITNDERKELVDAVEKWSVEHPLVTNGMKVLEMIPYDEYLMPRSSDKDVAMIINREWWDAEYKEGE